MQIVFQNFIFQIKIEEQKTNEFHFKSRFPAHQRMKLDEGINKMEFNNQNASNLAMKIIQCYIKSTNEIKLRYKSTMKYIVEKAAIVQYFPQYASASTAPIIGVK